MDRFKALYWDSDGFILLYKRLERGRYQWPRSQEEVLSLSPQQFRWLLEGLSIHQPKAHKPVKDIVYLLWVKELKVVEIACIFNVFSVTFLPNFGIIEVRKSRGKAAERAWKLSRFPERNTNV